MAITFNDVYGGSSGGWTLQDGFSYSVDVQAVVDPGDPVPGAKAVMEATGLAWNATYRYPIASTATETDARAYLQSVEVSPASETGRVFKVNLKFGRYNANQEAVDPDTGVKDPFSEPPTLRGRGEEVEVAVAYDNAGNPVLNSAGEPFANAPTISLPTLVFEVSQLRRTFDPSLITSLQGHVNDAEWQGWPAGSVLCKSVTASRTWNSDTDSWAWDTSYEFAMREPIESGGVDVLPGWTLQILDCGYSAKDGTNPNKLILDKTGATVSDPVPLDGAGGRLDPADDPVYLEFAVYPEASFATLLPDLPPDLFSAGTV